MFIRPTQKDAVIRDPHTKRPLPAEGAEVADDSNFWQRRLRSKEVEIVKPSAPESKPAKGLKGGE